MAAKEPPDHWLVRPRTIRWLWITFSAVLVLTVALQLVFHVKGYFVVDGWFGFGAGFGFVACLSMVIFAKALGRLLTRDEHFYDD